MLRSLLHRLDDERGSLPMALLAVLMVSALMGVVTANVMAGEKQTRFDENYEKALQVADLGADRFFAMMKNGQTSTLPAAPNGGCAASTRPEVVEVRCLGVAAAPNAVPNMPNATYWVRAMREATDEWTILSTGNVGGTRRVVRLRNVKQRPFQHAMFGDQRVSFNGTPRQSYSYNGGTVTNTATIATNLTGSNGINVDESTFTRKTGTNTYNGVLLDQKQDVSSDAAITFASEQLATCQAAGTITANFTGPWQPGTYCVQNLAIPDNSTISLPVTATQANPVRIFVQGNVQIGRRALVNCGTTGERCVWPPDPANLALPGALQIYSVGDGQVTFGTESKIAAAIFAPRSHCFSTPHAQVFGALVCRVIGEFTGHFRLYYDEALRNLPVAERRVWSEEQGG